jgi:hypothetical protein
LGKEKSRKSLLVCFEAKEEKSINHKRDKRKD